MNMFFFYNFKFAVQSFETFPHMSELTLCFILLPKVLTPFKNVVSIGGSILNVWFYSQYVVVFSV